MSFSYTSHYLIQPSCWRQGSPLCPCLRPRPPVIVAAQVLKEQKPLSGSGEDHARIGCALFYTDDRQPASDHQSLQNSMTHARSGLSDLLLVRAHLLFLSSQTRSSCLNGCSHSTNLWANASLWHKGFSFFNISGTHCAICKYSDDSIMKIKQIS